MLFVGGRYCCIYLPVMPKCSQSRQKNPMASIAYLGNDGATPTPEDEPTHCTTLFFLLRWWLKCTSSRFLSQTVAPPLTIPRPKDEKPLHDNILFPMFPALTPRALLCEASFPKGGTSTTTNTAPMNHSTTTFFFPMSPALLAIGGAKGLRNYTAAAQ